MASPTHPISTAAEREATKLLYTEALASWRKHPKYRSTLAHHFVEEVHPMFRRPLQQLVEKMPTGEGSGPMDVKGFQRVWNGLHHHHTAEDDMFFPRIKRGFPDSIPKFDFLEEDHKYLHPLVDRVINSKGEDKEAFVEFVSFLSDHLNREEMLIVPMMLGEESWSRKTGF
eukprot:PhF_6_TR5740/c0_g1_i1/m.8463